jgi:hypothetical protein
LGALPGHEHHEVAFLVRELYHLLPPLALHLETADQPLSTAA